MSVFIIVLISIVLMIVSMIVLPKIKIGKIEIGTYWIITLICALLLLLIGKVNINEMIETFTSDDSINPIKILVLFFSMTFISIFLDELGFFTYLASVATTKAKNSQYSIFIILYVLISILTVFTSNDVIILTFTPFICSLCKRLKVNPIPYLFSEFVAANTLSMTLIIGNPTNIYLGLKEELNFLTYFEVMGPIALLCASLALGLLILIFKKSLDKKIEKENIEAHLKNKPLVILSSIILLTCTALMAISNYINLEMWAVSLVFACILLVVAISNIIINKDYDSFILTIKRLPYELVPFLLSMFIIVLSLDEAGISLKFNELLGNNVSNYTYGFSSLLIANMMNNIPMSIFYSSVINNSLIATYATIISSNLAAILTPLGSLAGIMFLSILKKNDIKFGFKDFVKYGVIVSIPLEILGLSLLFFMI